MKRLHLILLTIIAAIGAQAQMVDPVKFSTQLNMLDETTGEIVFSGTIDKGWHVYSSDITENGPVKATFNTDKMDGVELVGTLKPQGNVVEKFDQMFGINVRYFENNVTLVQKIRFTKPHYSIACFLEYGACNDRIRRCMSSTVDFSHEGSVPALEQKAQKVIESTDSQANPEALEVPEALESPEAPDTLHDSISPVITEGQVDLWAPITSDLKAFDNEKSKGDSTLWFIFLSGLLGGFLAILTPCVWPIIPMTVSFFLKRNKDRKKAIHEATTYGLSIIIIYVLLGLAVTLLFGASALNALSTNAFFNIFFALLLVVFAASFFGAFELTLPTSWSNKIDQKSERATGLLSIFLMAFTLALVSFSCTGPIIGFLLVAISTQNDILGPTIGMLGFAIALAIPFTLFALFPSLLKSAPKSGGWMNTVKVVLGFIELAFALKFLSVADLAYGWHLLDREVFISLWIVLFALLGIYLLGWLKFSHDDDSRKTNVPKFFLGLISLAFAVYMVPGLWGAPLKAISAFAPPMSTQDFNLYEGSVEAQYTDYEQGMAAAKAEGKPVMVDFTGYGCVNCRKMEAAVWTDPKVQELLTKDYVLISLYVDDKTPLAEPIEVKENGRTIKLRTVGDKWSYLERVKIGANTQPYYVLLDNDGRPLNGLRSYNENIDEYVAYLKKGLSNYRKTH